MAIEIYPEDNKTSEFGKVLFRPDFGIQAGELNSLQNILQGQIGNLGRFNFKNGSNVIGGSVKIVKANTLVINNTYNGIEVDISELVGKTIEEIDSSNNPTGAKGQVLIVSKETDTEPAAIHYSSENSIEFGTGTAVRTTDNSLFVNIRTTENPVRTCLIARMTEGYFFFNDRLIAVPKQEIVASKFTSVYNGSIGIVYTDEIITGFDDENLYDQSRGSPNFNAPGAHRLKINGVLTSKNVGETVEGFSTLMEIRNGSIQTNTSDPQLSVLGDILAKRTHDESGDYVKEFFTGTIKDRVEKNVVSVEPATLPLRSIVKTAYEHNYQPGDFVILNTDNYSGEYEIETINSITSFTIILNTSNSNSDIDGIVYRRDYFGIDISPGKAYVRGYPVEFESSIKAEIRKAIDTRVDQNDTISGYFGNYIRVENFVNLPDISSNPELIFRNGSGTIVGRGNVYSVSAESFTKIRIHMTSYYSEPGQNISTATIVEASDTITGGAFSADLVDNTLNASDSSTSIVELSSDKLATLETNGNTTITGVFDTKISSSVNLYTLSSGQELTQPVNVNLVNTSFKHDFIFIDTAGNHVNPTSIIINTAGNEVTTTGLTGTVFMIVGTKRVIDLGTKNRINSTVVATAGTFNSSNRTLEFTGVYDAYTFTAVENGIDISDRFDLDTGQRDNWYQDAVVTLKQGSIIPTNAVTFEIAHYNHTGNVAYNIDSYPNNSVISTYTNSLGRTISLRNSIDFRPYTNTAPNVTTSYTIPSTVNTMTFDRTYYMPRKDLITLNSGGFMEIVEGIPNDNPSYPAIPSTNMVLFKINVPSLTNDINEVTIDNDQIRRWTMEDIGILAKRVTRVEEQTALSLLESSAKAEPIYDDNGLTRFKTGFIVDSFEKHGLGDTNSIEYRVSIDKNLKSIRPLFTRNAVALNFNNRVNIALSGNEQTGYFLSNEYTVTDLVKNDIASKTVSVTPYLTTKRVGTMQVNPPADFWVDTTTAPVNNSSIENDLLRVPVEIGRSWNDWETNWTGTRNLGIGLEETTTNQTRSGFSTLLTSITSTTSLGSSIIDSSLSYFIRAQNLTVTISGLRPDTDLHVFFDGTKMNNNVSNVSSNPVGQGVVRSNALGDASFTLAIPGGTFVTGQRDIVVTDESNNVEANASTYAKFNWSASGLNTTNRENTITIRQPQITTVNISDSRTDVEVTQDPIVINNITNVTNTTNRRTNIPWWQQRGSDGEGRNDPLAQSFYISNSSYPNGVFLKELDVFFSRIPASATAGPVTLQIRPMVNGYPSSKMILPDSEVLIPYDSVNLPDLTNDIQTIRSTPTTVTFDVPIYLEPDREYCFVLLANDPDYEIYVSEMGQNIVGSDVTIFNQPLLGSSFRSQNAETWTAYQNEDLMFNARVCLFDTDEVGSYDLVSEVVSEDIDFNLIKFQSQQLSFPTSNQESTLIHTSSSTLTPSARSIEHGENILLENENILRSTNNSDLYVSTKIYTSDPYTSCFIDTTKQNAILIANIIDNKGLVKPNFTIDSGGSGYSASTTISITSGGGSGAVVTPVIESGIITDIEIVSLGFGYTSQPVITVNDLTGVGAVISYEGFETDPSNGGALSKYVSYPITLENGFESDLGTCIIDVNIPNQTSVEIYFRGRGTGDPDLINTIPWKLANEFLSTTQTGSTKSLSSQFVTKKFEIDLSYTGSNGTAYTDCKEIQAKIVLLSSNTSKVPQCKNLQVITSV